MFFCNFSSSYVLAYKSYSTIFSRKNNSGHYAAIIDLLISQIVSLMLNSLSLTEDWTKINYPRDHK